MRNKRCVWIMHGKMVRVRRTRIPLSGTRFATLPSTRLHQSRPFCSFIYQLEIFFILNSFFSHIFFSFVSFLQLYLCKNYETSNGTAELYAKWGSIDMAWLLLYRDGTGSDELVTICFICRVPFKKPHETESYEDKNIYKTIINLSWRGPCFPGTVSSVTSARLTKLLSSCVWWISGLFVP